jgi:predicted aconitase with swiveling domain
MPEGRTLVPGEARGPALVLTEPLSFWGGLDPATGAIVDVHHPQRGAVVTGTVLVMPGGRGSSSSSSVLAEAIRAGTAPAAIVLAEPDPIIALGAIVARELYGAAVPVLVAEGSALRSGEVLDVAATAVAATIDRA